MAKSTFIINDENTVNSYGFRVLTDGIDIVDFVKNPVMLAQHERGVLQVIGKWENIRKEGGKLLADAVFDMADEFAAKVAGKVERGFLKATSLGIKPLTESTNKSTLIKGQTHATVTTSKLREVSIVDIPSNADSLKLFDAEPPKKIEKQTKKDMDLLKLSLALGFSDAVTEEQLLAKVGELNTAKETLTVELADLKTKEADAKVKQITLAVESAIKDGRIQASQKESITKLMNADFEEGMDFINALEAKKGVPDTIAVQLAAANGGGGTAAPVVKDYAWYEQNDPKELVRLMNEETERYEALLVSYK